MEGFLILLVLGFFLGWGLGIGGWVQARRARREIDAVRQALEVALARGGLAGLAGAAQGAAETPSAGPERPGPWAPPPRPDPVPAWLRPAPAPEPAFTAPPPPPPPADEALAAEDPAPAAVPPAPAPARPRLEEVLTLRWGMWLGAGAILLAGVFLVRTAVEEGWLGPGARCVLAGLLGLALIGAAEWLRRRPAPAEGGAATAWPDLVPAALAAGGVAVLFGAAYATAVLYALVPPLAGFALLALAALAGLALALRHGPLVATVGIACAYLTPALVDTEDPSLPGLFAYLLLVTAAALAVVRQVAAAWLGWIATAAAALWVVVGGLVAEGPGELWAPSLFVPVAAALHLALLPGAALEGALGRRLAWLPVLLLAGAALLLVPGAGGGLAPAAGLLLLTPVTLWKAMAEPRLDRLPWLAALAGLLLLLAWSIPDWAPSGEAVTVAGLVQGILPIGPWPPEALRPFLGAALLLAAMHGLAGAWQERRAPHPLHWAALPAAVPVLVLLVAYARVRGFAPDLRWALAALALAAALVGLAGAAMRGAAVQRAGVHAAGAVAALALGCAMVLSDHWLTLAVALMLPPLAWVEARADLPALRRIAAAVAALVLVRLLLNLHVLEYGFGATPVLNGLLAAYGVPAAAFALAAALFRRRGDDTTVALLEAGALAFVTALLLLQIRHALTGGDLQNIEDWSFREAALQCFGLALLAGLVRLLNRRLGGRPVFAWGWRLQQGAALGLGVVLVLANPAFESGAVLLQAPVLNELLLAYALPAALAAAAAGSPEGGRPPVLRVVLALYALLAAFAWVTLEVRHQFHPIDMSLELEGIEPAELYAYSGAWLGFGAFLLAIGIRNGIPALRLAALGVLGLTILKAFLVDMAELTGLWRVLSFLGLGLALIALGWVYRRFVVGAAPTTGGAAPPLTGSPAPAPPG